MGGAGLERGGAGVGGEGTGKSSLLSPSLPTHSGACWVAPREPQNLGFSCPPHIPSCLYPACFQLSRTASDFSVLTPGSCRAP